MRNQKQKTKRKPYATDLSEAEWAIIEPLLPPPSKEGKPRTVDIREVINAILYLLKSGCAWRLLPNDFPKWQLVYYYFRTWKKKTHVRMGIVLFYTRALYIPHSSVSSSTKITHHLAPLS